MIITKKELLNTLMKYINREIDLNKLVKWAEDMTMDADFDENDFDLLRDIVGHLGLSDVKEFGLSWDDCYNYLRRLGYNPRVELVPA